MTRNSEPFNAEAALARIQALQKKLEEAKEALNSEPSKDEASLAHLQALQKKLEDDKEALANLQEYISQGKAKIAALEKKVEEKQEARKLAEEKIKAQKIKAHVKAWFQDAYPNAEMPRTLEVLLDLFATPEDLMNKYSSSKLKGGADAAVLMAPGGKEVLEKIAEFFPTDVEHACKFAVCISGYMEMCLEKLEAETTKGFVATEGQSSIMTRKLGDEQEDQEDDVPVADSKEDKDDHVESHDADAASAKNKERREDTEQSHAAGGLEGVGESASAAPVRP